MHKSSHGIQVIWIWKEDKSLQREIGYKKFHIWYSKEEVIPFLPAQVDKKNSAKMSKKIREGQVLTSQFEIAKTLNQTYLQALSPYPLLSIQKKDWGQGERLL